jgi:hypothetical protein
VFFILKIFLARSTENVAAEKEKNLAGLETNFSFSKHISPTRYNSHVSGYNAK